MYFRSLSVHVEICLFECSFVTCSMSSVSMLPVLSTCRYFKYLHVDIIRMAVMFKEPVNPSLIGYVATDVKYAQTVFEVSMLTISMNI